MATAAGEEGKGVDDTISKESGDGLKDPKRLSGTILPHILKLYESSATARDFEIYAPNATFEDPLMCAHGVKQIKSAFYSLPKVFGESKIVEYSIEETTTGPGRGEILIHNKQHYKLMGKDVDVVSLITLRIEEGKVVRHEDWYMIIAQSLGSPVFYTSVGQETSAEQRDCEGALARPTSRDCTKGFYACNACSDEVRQGSKSMMLCC